MTRNEFRNLIINAEEDSEMIFEITEKEHIILRKMVWEVKRYGYDIRLWTRRIDKDRRKAIFTKIKNGDVEQYKKDTKWE